MIDLHLHTRFSDGVHEPEYILEEAEKKKLKAISITDHNTCKAYDKIKNQKIFSGEIISGCELNCTYKGKLLEILGYGVNTTKIDETLKDFYSQFSQRDILINELNISYNACVKEGIKAELNAMLEKVGLEKYKYSTNILLDEVNSHPENKEKASGPEWQDNKLFYRTLQANPNSIWYMPKNYPELTEAIKIIRNAGGIVFFAHPFEYRIENFKVFLDDLIANNELDGIEAYYTTFSNEDNEFILEYCKNNNLLVSGGSDYHGGEIGKDAVIGKGNKEIPDWVYDQIVERLNIR